MIDALYVTADAVGTETGGGAVTRHESEALAEAGFPQRLRIYGPGHAHPTGCEKVDVWSFPDAPRPWGADREAAERLRAAPDLRPALAHFYSGTFTETIKILKERGCRVTYTAAAHSIDVSREEHEKLGWPFDYPHLNEPKLWARYVEGYLLADVVVCPSTLSKRCMESYGCKRVEVIPHGVDLPPVAKPLPSRFSVAYLGQPGADKGLIYLLKAWRQLDHQNATLTIAGRGTEQLLGMVREHGGGNVYLRGWVERAGDVYDQCSVYVQPSASEGFGLEVLEAMAHGRPVICSRGAGAADVAAESPSCVVVPARDVDALAAAIDTLRPTAADSASVHAVASKYTWESVRRRYQEMWGS